MGHFSSFLRVSGLALVLGFLSSCGSGDGAPHLSTIQFGPSGADAIRVAGTAGAPVTHEILVTLLGPNGQPLSDTGFTIIGSTLYEGFISEGNAVPAASGQFKTGQFGSKKFTVTSGNISYLDIEVTILEVWSGSAYNRFNVTVECVNNPPDNCPS